MTILISHPESFQNEAEILNRILGGHSDVILHLRKPDFTKEQAEKLIQSLNSELYSRIVIHQHFLPAADYQLKGIHLKEADRSQEINYPAKIISTSFHSLKDALAEEERFEYFFCSPVFQSISKPEYSSAEKWDISAQPESFRKKAVALGGIDSSKREEISAKGFKNFAVLGAVWNSKDPLAAFNEIVQAFDA